MARGDVREAAKDRQEAVAAFELDTAPTAEPGSELEIRDTQRNWTPQQVAALTAIGVKGATPADLSVFFYVCQTSGLSPYRKQIYMIMRMVWDSELQRKVPKQTIQTGIDGFRVVRDRAAARHGWTAEFEETLWYDADGKPTEVWLGDEPPTACKVVLVKVFADGRRARVPHLIRFDAYADRKGGSPTGELMNRWRTDPAGMIAKCAEAGASRKAAPEELSGLYIGEELEASASGPQAWRHRPPVQATAEVVHTEPAQPQQPAQHPAGNDDPDVNEQRKTALARIHVLFGEAGWGGTDDAHRRVRRLVASNLGREAHEDPLLRLAGLEDLDVWTAERVAERLAQFIAQRQNPHGALQRMATAAARELGEEGKRDDPGR